MWVGCNIYFPAAIFLISSDKLTPSLLCALTLSRALAISHTHTSMYSPFTYTHMHTHMYLSQVSVDDSSILPFGFEHWDSVKRVLSAHCFLSHVISRNDSDWPILGFA